MNLERKLLDGPSAGYCSSSDGEDDGGFRVVNDEDEHQANVMKQFGAGSNTGPKGVMNDWRRFRDQQTEDRIAKDKAILLQAKRGMFEGNKADREQAQKSSDEDEDSLESLRRKRLTELKKVASGRMIEIQTKTQFLSLTESSGAGLVAVLIYEPNREDCNKITNFCKILAAEHPSVKFARATCDVLGMSDGYKNGGVPTLQFYVNNGNLVGNFVSIANEIGQDASVAKLKSFLKSHRISLTLNTVMDGDDYSSTDELD